MSEIIITSPLDLKQLEIIRDMVAANPTIVLSGSYALMVEDVKTRRQVKDLDFLMPQGTKFVRPESIKHRPASTDYLPNEYWERDTYRCPGVVEAGSYISGVDIDVFSPTEDTPDLTHFCANHTLRYKVDEETHEIEIDVLHPEIVMMFKLMFSLDPESTTRHKHITDLVYTTAALL